MLLVNEVSLNLFLKQVLKEEKQKVFIGNFYSTYILPHRCNPTFILDNYKQNGCKNYLISYINFKFPF